MYARCRATLLLMVVLAGGLVMRLYTLSTGDKLQQAAAAQQTYVLQVAQTRGTIYDCRFQPVTNNTWQQVTAAVASPAAVTAIRKYVNEEQRQQVLDQLQSGKPALFVGKLPEETSGAVTLTVPQRYGNGYCAPHLVGYVDTQGKGVCGIEADYDEWLRSHGGHIQVRYRADAWGRTLNGEALSVLENSADHTGGVVLTIDRDIQLMAEQIAAEQLQSGAVVIMESATGKIRAMVSVPDYHAEGVQAAVTQPNSPMMNRALTSYNVGSIFKLVSACCAVEQNYSDMTMDCTGTMMHHDREFQCIYANAHGKVGLSRAVAVSCNCYFIALAEQLGAKSIYNMAEKLGFGQKIILSDSIASEKGSLPDLQDLSAPAALANFSFGQGNLMATPLQIAGMIQAIANNGIRIEPALIEGIVDGDGVFSPAELAEHEQVMEETTAQRVKQMMGEAIMSGTAMNAAPNAGTAGAKTATAETGWIQNGQAVIQAWCAGYYSPGETEYVIVVLGENGRSGSRTCAPVFKQIADELWKIQEERR